MKSVALILGMGLMAGCSVDSVAGREPQRLTLTYSIDVVFSDEQTEQIRIGVEYWRGELTNVNLVEEPRQVCTVNTTRCIVGVQHDDESLWDEEHQRFAGGKFHGGVASISLNKDLRMSALPILTAHELGHRWGLRHDESIDGVMNASIGEETLWELTEEQRWFLESLNLI